MQKIIDAEKSDLFDVLAYVAYALPPLNREERAARAKVAINSHFNTEQRGFLDFVLAHYVSVGRRRVGSGETYAFVAPQISQLHFGCSGRPGKAEGIGQIFAGFQKYLYQVQASA